VAFDQNISSINHQTSVTPHLCLSYFHNVTPFYLKMHWWKHLMQSRYYG